MWRKIAAEPYRLFFPLGLLLAWAGVLHWFLHALGWFESFRLIFHAMAQVEGFLACFAAGFVLTMLPRRTESAAPGPVVILLCALAPIGTTYFAWRQSWAISQIFWLVFCGAMLAFTVPRLRRGERAAPEAFLFLPMAFGLGIAGALLTGVGAAMGLSAWWLHDLGRRIVLQGVFLCLIIGVGALALPLMTRGEKPADASDSPHSRRRRQGMVLGMLVLIATFWIEAKVSLRLGLFTRGLVSLVMLLFAAGIHRAPTLPGLNRRLMWIAAWMIPVGYLLGALLIDTYKAGLHVTFIGGFTLLTLSVSTHVSLGHGGRGSVMAGRPLPLIVLGGSILIALVFRALMALDLDHYFTYMAVASGAFLLATLCWVQLLYPKLRLLVLLGSAGAGVLLAELTLTLIATWPVLFPREGFDHRSPMEVAHATKMVPTMKPSMALGRPGLLPLSGIGTASTAFCNESGEYIFYRSDARGFNNPEWPSRADLVVTGDSYAMGQCVPPAQSVAGRLRAAGMTAVNVGYSGNGPLLALASLVDHGLPLGPQTVVWLFYEGNDVSDLTLELTDPRLRRYLDDTTPQARPQAEVDHYWRRYIETYEAPDLISLNLRNVVAFRQVRGALGLLRHQVSSLDPLDDVFSAARDACGDRRLLLVYVPSYRRLSGARVRNRKAEVLAIARDNDLEVLDAAALFEAHPDPLSFFWFRRSGHFNVEGYRFLSDAIIEALGK